HRQRITPPSRRWKRCSRTGRWARTFFRRESGSASISTTRRRSSKRSGSTRRAAGPPKTTRDLWTLWPARKRQVFMPSKKKPRPLFEVPEDVGAGRESGWVYRSEARPADAPVESAIVYAEDTSVQAGSANALALAMAALAQTFVLGMTIAAI